LLKIALKGKKCKQIAKSREKIHEKGAKMGSNGVFERFLDVFVIPMTKKCTKTNIF
jgi:hypothetical protein